MRRDRLDPPNPALVPPHADCGKPAVGLDSLDAWRNYFLKMAGAADWPIENRWIDQRADLLYGVRTPRQPRAIGRGDLLVYYAAGEQKLFAIARATQDGDNIVATYETGEERWPFRIPVQVYLAIPTLGLAPSWSVLGLPSGTVQQKSYVEISRAQYEMAFNAIVERARAD